ncbi:MAG: hypothetical protein LUC45_03755 [Paraprevotella sp.]|nr:hypothetical protein [Paraprevotella sp.]
MKKLCFMVLLTTMTAVSLTGCKNKMEGQIIGKYEHPALPGQTFEFSENHKFMNTAVAGTMDCKIKYPGTWTIDGDSLYITNDTKDVTYEFGKSVTEQQKQLIKGLLKTMSKNEPARQAFKILDIDDKVLNLEHNNQVTTYARIENKK